MPRWYQEAPEIVRSRVVDCRCRRRGTSALYILNFKDGNLILFNLLLRLVYLVFSQRDNNRLLLRLFHSLFSTAFFWFLWHINAGFGFCPRLSSLLRCPAKLEYYHGCDVVGSGHRHLKYLNQPG